MKMDIIKYGCGKQCVKLEQHNSQVAATVASQHEEFELEFPCFSHVCFVFFK